MDSYGSPIKYSEDEGEERVGNWSLIALSTYRYIPAI